MLSQFFKNFARSPTTGLEVHGYVIGTQSQVVGATRQLEEAGRAHMRLAVGVYAFLPE